jgi:hypothetical protein
VHPSEKMTQPGRAKGVPVLQNSWDAIGVHASDQALNRVESPDRCVSLGIPEELVAPPDGTRTTDFAVLYGGIPPCL